METIVLNRDPARYDEVLHALGCPPEHGDLELAFKERATVGGRTGVAITFTVLIPPAPGSGAEPVRQRVQCVTTLRALRNAILSLPMEE
jgi:hypothetical protein